MRYIFGTLALAAAVVIVGYSATTLFTAAYASSGEPWQQTLAGTGAAAIVLWEATALILIGAAWHRGYRPVAVMSAALLVVAMLVTLTWETQIVIGGQADKAASREVQTKKLADVDNDLKWVRERRDQLNGKASSKAVREELDWITNRLDVLEKARDDLKAVKEINPGAAWASRFSGWGNEQTWVDAFSAIKLLFWMLARVCAAPLAVAAMMGVPTVRPERRTAPEAVHATTIAKAIVPPATPPLKLSDEAFARPSDDGDSIPVPASPPPLTPKEGEEVSPLVRTDLARKMAAEAMEVPRLATVDGREIPPTKGEIREARSNRKKKIDTAETKPVDAWAAIFLRKVPGKRITGKQGRKHYEEYRKMVGLPSIGPRAFSKQLGEHIDRLEGIKRRPGERRPRNGMGAAWQGYDLVEIKGFQNMRASA